LGFCREQAGDAEWKYMQDMQDFRLGIPHLIAEQTLDGAEQLVLFALPGVIGPISDASAALSPMTVPNLAARAKELHSALGNAVAIDRRTTAVLAANTGDGLVNIVSSSRNALSPIQRALLGPTEIAATGVGHAEITAANYALAQGWTPIAVGVSRAICSECVETLKALGILY
jgi:hypothetical protein